MATLEDALNQLAAQINLTATATGQYGNAFQAKLNLPQPNTPAHPPVATAGERLGGGGTISPHHGLLDVSGTVEVRKIVQEPVNLQWISEGVLFGSESTPPAASDLAIPPAILDQMPVQPSIPLAGSTVPAGVPGTIGLLTGTIPVFQILNELVTATATIEARWRVLDENHVPIDGFAWSLGPGMSGSGSELVPPANRILNTALDLVLVPPFVDLVSLTPPAPVRRFIQAHFRLSAAGVSTPWIDLEAPVDLVPLAIPTALFLFFDPDFGGPMLVVLPANSQLGPDLLLQTLGKVSDVLGTVRELVAFVGLFIDAVNGIGQGLSNVEIQVTKADAIENLNDIDVVGTPWWAVWRNDREAEDEMASLIFLGAPGRSLQAFNDRSFNDDEGQLNINIGPEMAVTIRTLYHSQTSDFVGPDVVPDGRVTVAKQPSGCRGTWCFLGGGHKITTFGDEFSSLRFGW
jgi:hypothetical protein